MLCFHDGEGCSNMLPVPSFRVMSGYIGLPLVPQGILAHVLEQKSLITKQNQTSHKTAGSMSAESCFRLMRLRFIPLNQSSKVASGRCMSGLCLNLDTKVQTC